MERLTERDGRGIPKLKGISESQRLSPKDRVIILDGVDRLAAYEDTGLTPEDVSAQFDLLRKYSEAADGIEVKRIRELAQAEKDGRLVVLPCKVGDPVYVTYSEGYRLHVVDRIYVAGNQKVRVRMRNPCTMSETLRLDASNFGKTVFLTEEEAVKALMEEGDRVDH